MPAGRTHRAVADLRRAGSPAATQEQAFAQAASRWAEAIVGDLPTMALDGAVIVPQGVRPPWGNLANSRT